MIEYDMQMIELSLDRTAWRPCPRDNSHVMLLKFPLPLIYTFSIANNNRLEAIHRCVTLVRYT